MTPTITTTSTITPTATPTPDTIACYPNPYSPTKAYNGTLKFDFLPQSSDIAIYNIEGYLVKEIDNVSGRIEWNGTNTAGDKCVPGIYMYIVTAPGNKYTGKIYIVK